MISLDKETDGKSRLQHNSSLIWDKLNCTYIRLYSSLNPEKSLTDKHPDKEGYEAWQEPGNNLVESQDI